MVACHLELGQLWRCPVTWCAVWKGSGRACLEHLAEKHGGSTLEIKTNVFPPWTVTRDVWHDARRPDVSGVAVDALLFHEASRRLVHRYRVYKDPFPHPTLRNGVIPRLLSSVCRAMAIARLTPTLDTTVGCSAGKSAGVLLSGGGVCCCPASPSPCVIRGGRRHATHEGRFAGVIRDKPTTDAAGGGGIGGRYADMGGR